MTSVKPIPEGYPQVMPYLTVDDANAAIDFYTTVFGAKERLRMPAPEGKIGHAELEIGDSVVMLADAFPDMGNQTPAALGGTPVTVMVYVRRRRRRIRPCAQGGRDVRSARSRISSTAIALVSS